MQWTNGYQQSLSISQLMQVVDAILAAGNVMAAVTPESAHAEAMAIIARIPELVAEKLKNSSGVGHSTIVTLRTVTGSKAYRPGLYCLDQTARLVIAYCNIGGLLVSVDESGQSYVNGYRLLLQVFVDVAV